MFAGSEEMKPHPNTIHMQTVASSICTWWVCLWGSLCTTPWVQLINESDLLAQQTAGLPNYAFEVVAKRTARHDTRLQYIISGKTCWKRIGTDWAQIFGPELPYGLNLIMFSFLIFQVSIYGSDHTSLCCHVDQKFKRDHKTCPPIWLFNPVLVEAVAALLLFKDTVWGRSLTHWAVVVLYLLHGSGSVGFYTTV